MTAGGYGAWLARAREHHTSGRIIDAMLCYRRALRDDPRGADARFHLAEIAWHTGNAAEAILGWRVLCAELPAHAASWHALADASAAQGDLAASREAILRMLALRPGDARGQALLALLEAALDTAPNATRRDDAIVAALRAGPWPLGLLARIAEAAAARSGVPDDLRRVLGDAALAAPVATGNEDALRRIALALARVGRDDDAGRVAARYAEACRALHRATRPLPWPLRCAGDRVRVAMLVRDADDAAALLPEFAEGRGDRELEPTLLIPAAGEPTRARHDAAAIVLVLHPPDAAARTVAALDCDVLVDAIGLDAPVAPLLALRPARRIVSIARHPLPALADETYRADPAAWRPALHALAATIAGEPTAPVTAAELDAQLKAAVLAHQRGELAEARAGYAALHAVQPTSAGVQYLAAAAARDDGDMQTAVRGFREAIASAPAYVEARVALVAALVDAGEAEDAARVAEAGLRSEPASAALLRALGQAELARGRTHDAIAAFEQALARDPTNGEAHYNLGVALQGAGRLSEAARAYQRALAFRPDLDAAHFNLGVVFDRQGRAEAAIAAFSHVLRRAPEHVASYKALGETLFASGRYDAWFANFERFERHCPGHLALAANALEVGAYRGDFARIERYLDGLRHERFSAPRVDEMQDALEQLLYLLHFFDVEPELLGRHARTYDALARKLHGEPRPPRERRAGRIRIGYVSGDFRNHVMGKMMLEALRRHDGERFEVFGYATTGVRDAWTPRFAEVFHGFASLAELGDQDAVERIAADDLDVLVDLSTHTRGARPAIFARKPARVAITHVASAGTLGLSAIDFKLTDRYADVAYDPVMQIEPLLAMEGCVYPYRHVAPSATAPFTREELRIAPGAVVLAAFSTPLKLSQRCLALWREIFARVQNAVLAFSPVHPALHDVYRRLAAVAAVDAARVVFVPQGRDDAESQARYRVVDLVLDPMPYGGVNGTLEALDMGVPVVTLVGRRHAERTSYSILANLGVTDTVAQSGADYVAIAVRLATDGDFRRSVRERIERNLAASPLTDMAAHTRHLEDAYLRALELRAPSVLRATR